MDSKETLGHIWAAFSILSKAQAIVSNNPLGYRSLDAVETIEEAKRHLNHIFMQTTGEIRYETEEPEQLTALN